MWTACSSSELMSAAVAEVEARYTSTSWRLEAASTSRPSIRPSRVSVRLGCPAPAHMMCKVYRTVVSKIGCTEFGSISERKVTAATNRHYITELKGLSHEIDFKSFDKSLQD